MYGSEKVKARLVGPIMIYLTETLLGKGFTQ